MGNHDVSAEQSFAEAERLYEQNKFTAARRSYEEAICYAPNHSDAHFGLGLALIALGECALAKQTLRYLMRLDPEYPTAMSHYGIACLEIDELEEAQAAFDMALKLDDQDHLAIFGLATLSLLDEDYEAALEQVNRALAISPDEAGYRNLLGIVYSELGRRGEALEAFRDAMRLDPVASAKILRNIATLHEVSWN